MAGKFRKNVLYNKKPKERFHFAKHDGIEMWTYFGIPKGLILSMKKQTELPVKYDFEGRGGF